MVMAQGLLLVLIGVTAGLAVALVLSQVLESLLFGVTAHDPLTFATVTALLVIVGLVASVIPARRAMQVNPIVALRNE
jgi:ABC-type antimicrobial peptide transport system permease subunit